MKLKITVLGVEYEVDVEVLDEGGFVSSTPVVAMPVYHAAPPMHNHAPVSVTPPPRPASSNGIPAPVSGTIMAIMCKPGDNVKRGQTLLTLEAMKMETKIAADRDGVIKSVYVKANENIREGQQLVDFE